MRASYEHIRPPPSPTEEARRDATNATHEHRITLGLLIGHLAVLHGAASAAEMAGVSRQVASYWQRKFMDPRFHPGTWGGWRPESTAFFDSAGTLAAEQAVLWAFQDDVTVSFRELLEKVWEVPDMEAVSPAWLSRTLQSWGWNWARARLVARHRYTEANINWYAEFVSRILDWPLNKVSSVFVIVC